MAQTTPTVVNTRRRLCVFGVDAVHLAAAVQSFYETQQFTPVVGELAQTSNSYLSKLPQEIIIHIYDEILQVLYADCISYFSKVKDCWLSKCEDLIVDPDLSIARRRRIPQEEVIHTCVEHASNIRTGSVVFGPIKPSPSTVIEQGWNEADSLFKASAGVWPWSCSLQYNDDEIYDEEIGLIIVGEGETDLLDWNDTDTARVNDLLTDQLDGIRPETVLARFPCRFDTNFSRVRPEERCARVTMTKSQIPKLQRLNKGFRLIDEDSLWKLTLVG